MQISTAICCICKFLLLSIPSPAIPPSLHPSPPPTSWSVTAQVSFYHLNHVRISISDAVWTVWRILEDVAVPTAQLPLDLDLFFQGSRDTRSGTLIEIRYHTAGWRLDQTRKSSGRFITYVNQSICWASCSSSCWIVATHGGAGRISLFFYNNGERQVCCLWSSKVSLQPSVSGIYIGLSLLLQETSSSSKCSRNEELNHLATTIIRSQLVAYLQFFCSLNIVMSTLECNIISYTRHIYMSRCPRSAMNGSLLMFNCLSECRLWQSKRWKHAIRYGYIK